MEPLSRCRYSHKCLRFRFIALNSLALRCSLWHSVTKFLLSCQWYLSAPSEKLFRQRQAQFGCYIKRPRKDRDEQQIIRSLRVGSDKNKHESSFNKRSQFRPVHAAEKLITIRPTTRLSCASFLPCSYLFPTKPFHLFIRLHAHTSIQL